MLVTAGKCLCLLLLFACIGSKTEKEREAPCFPLHDFSAYVDSTYNFHKNDVVFCTFLNQIAMQVCDSSGSNNICVFSDTLQLVEALKRDNRKYIIKIEALKKVNKMNYVANVTIVSITYAKYQKTGLKSFIYGEMDYQVFLQFDKKRQKYVLKKIDYNI